MTWDVVASLAVGAWGAASAACVPAVLARVPEPAPDLQPELDPIQPAADEQRFSRPLEVEKETYASVAAAPGLRARCAAAGLLLGALLGGRYGWSPALLPLGFLLPVGLLLTVVDWRTRYLPTRVIWPSCGVVLVLCAVASVLSGDLGRMVPAVVGGLASYAGFFLLAVLVPRGMGFGDVRLAALLGIALGWLGVGPLLLGLYTGFLLGGVGGTLLSALRVFHRRHYPFGPFMLAGAYVAAVFPDVLAAAYGAVVDGIAGLLG